MATTVGQHSVAAFTSPVNGTTPIDANTVRGNDNTVRVAYVDHDADPGIHVQSSTIASRPAAGTAGRKWITEDSGVYTLWFDDGTNWHPVSSENVALTVLATENLAKGDVVKVTGWNNGQDLPEVAKVSSASDTAFAIITAAVTNGAMGYATNTGIVQDLATNGFSFGATLYPNTSGGFTATKPTSGTYQPCAYVLRSNANNGVLYVEFSAPRIVESSSNTASTVVQRDASGNFSAGTITAGALTSTGLVTFASLKGTGATTVTDILNDSTMATASATTLATSASIKTYVDNKVATVDTLAEVLANGNTTGANDIIVNAGQKIRTPLIASQNNATAITIADTTGALTLASALADSNLATISTAGKVANSATTATSANTASAIVARDSSGNFSAGTITANLTGNISGTAPAGTLTGTTLASNVVSSSLTSVGTLTSLTVSGDLTVDTSTLKVDSANNRVGIGTATPGNTLHVIGGNAGQLLLDNGNQQFTQLLFQRNSTANTGGDILIDGTGTTFNFRSLAANMPFVWQLSTSAGSPSEKMRLDASGNLAVDTNTLYVDATNNRVGVGTASPGSTLDIRGVTNVVLGGTPLSWSADVGLGITRNGTSGSSASLALSAGNTGAAFLYFGNSTTQQNGALYYDNNTNAMVFQTNGGSEKMRLDASGNLGLGVTPSAWSTGKAIEIAGTGLRASLFQSNSGVLSLAQNYYFNGSNDIYVANGYATRYYQLNGQHVWNTAASGTAGNTISFTQAMTLDASGNLGVGITSPAARLDVKATSGTLFRCEYTGVAQLNIANGGTSTNYYDGDLQIFRSGGGTERARITSGGLFQVTADGANQTFTNSGQIALKNTGSAPYISWHESTGARIGYLQMQSTGSANLYVEANQPLVFATNNTERARITSGGNFELNSGKYVFNNNAPSALTVNSVEQNNGGGETFIAYSTGAGASRFYVGWGGTVYATNTTISAISDARLKENIRDLDVGLDAILALKPRKFDWKEGKGTNQKDVRGFIAQEFEEVFPDLIDQWKDPAPEGEEPYRSVRPDLIPVLVKAIQEQQAMITALEARLEALEA